MELPLERLTRILQASISPVALISGVGLLILSLTNRFGRVMDRIREIAASTERNREKQLAILMQRASLLRHSITCAVASVLVTSVLVLGLFAIAAFEVRLRTVVLPLFAISLLLLIASLVLFLRDMHLSLRALKEELQS